MSGGEPVVRHDAAQHRYELLMDCRVIGLVDYRERPGRVALVHTEIEPALRGRGLGTRLVEGALRDLRERGARVVPLCPFIAGYIRHHPGSAEL